MRIPLTGLVLAIVAAAADEELCRSCTCETASLVPMRRELASDRDWSPFSVTPNPNGKYLSVRCSGGRIGTKLPPITVDGVVIVAEGVGLVKFPDFPDAARRKVLQMSLRRNGITGVTVDDVADYQQLRYLDVSGNGIGRVSELAFSNLRNLIKLDLSGNVISVVERWWSSDVDLTHLNLADNVIGELRPESFRSLTNLIYLDLSNNMLSRLPIDFSTSLTGLRFLQLTKNNFEAIPRVPRSLYLLNASSNSLRSLVLPQIDDLAVLDVSRNNLEDLDNVYDQLGLQILRLSHNRLTDFGSWKGDNLKILDLGYNQLRSVPEEINSERLPQLQRLYLDGNPLGEISFNLGRKPFPNLDELGLSQLGNITKIDQEVFKGVLLESYINCAEESGITVNLSNNMLKTIDGETFRNFPICSVDLSNNRLTSIPEGLLPWQYLRSANLQNNPWNCICDLQWMLDYYVPRAYVDRPENLFELRCAAPSHLKNRMLAYWYNSTKKIFCEGPSYYQYEISEGQYFEVWTASMIISAVLLCLIVVMLIAILVALFWRRKGRRIRGGKAVSRPLFSEIRINLDHKYNEIPQEGSTV